MDFTEQEYETQLFNFSQQSLVAGVKETINTVLEELIESVCNKLRTKYEASSVDEFSRKALELYRASIERHMSKIENVVKTYFSINPAILLPEDEVQEVQYSEEDEKRLDEKLKISRMEYIALVALEEKLREALSNLSENCRMLNNVAALEDPTSDLELLPRRIEKSINESFPSSLIESLVASLSLNDNREK